MKKIWSYILFVTCAMGSSEHTVPIGVTNINIPAGTQASPSYTFISSAYNQEHAYAGMIDEINGASLTLSNFSLAGYEDNELTQSGHLLRIVDGNADGNADMNSVVNGMVFPVIGHVGDVVTINATAAEISSYISLYDSIEIIKANTLESLFGVGDDFVGLTGKPSSGDNIYVWNSVGWKVYFHYNNKWQTFGTRSDQKETIIYPDEGMIYVRRSDAITLSFSGNVPLSVQCYRPPRDNKFLMSNPFPIAMNLSELIDTSSNWSSNTNIIDADQILVWTGSAWSIYFHNGTDWINYMTSQIDDKSIEAGSSFMIIRSLDLSITEGYNKVDLPD